jgi:hypothetical protein
VTGPSELRDSDDMAPSRGAIKTFGQGSGRKDRGSFSLATFTRGGGEQLDEHGQRHYDANHSSIWGLSSPTSRDQNESEEKLTVPATVGGTRNEGGVKVETTVVIERMG